LAGFDFDAALRWARFNDGRPLSRRGDEALTFVDRCELGGAPLLLDTCLYIDRMQGKVPERARALMGARALNHSTVAVQELMHAVGALDPANRHTANAIDAIGDTIRAMPQHRLHTPDGETLGRAALLAGLLCRQQNYANDRRTAALLDCVLYLQALKLGLTVLTRNLSDFDLLSQLLPQGRVLFYRVTPRGR